MGRNAVDNSTLEQWRLPDEVALVAAVSDYAKADTSYRALKNSAPSRWHASINGSGFKLLCTGPKFYDMRAKRGGADGIDLVMHTFKVEFKHAVAVLRERGL
jgi:hypothetical protein